MGTSTLTVLNQRLCPCWLMLYSLWTLTLCHLSDLSDLPLESAYADSNTWDWASGGVQSPLILEAPARLPGIFCHLCCWSSPPSLDRFCLQCWPCSNFSQPPDLTLCSVLSLLNRWPAGQAPELLLYLALCLGQLIDQFQCLASWSGQPPELSSMFPYSDALYVYFVLFLLRYPPPLRVKWVFWMVWEKGWWSEFLILVLFCILSLVTCTLMSTNSSKFR